jgi:hypothetical protein
LKTVFDSARLQLQVPLPSTGARRRTRTDRLLIGTGTRGGADVAVVSGKRAKGPGTDDKKKGKKAASVETVLPVHDSAEDETSSSWLLGEV